ncbi:MAG: ABC transporter, permease protein 2 (cluster 1, maltose/g3p/polyamine/iron), partial [uncultured Corynebacteriales bacterium]
DRAGRGHVHADRGPAAGAGAPARRAEAGPAVHRAGDPHDPVREPAGLDGGHVVQDAVGRDRPGPAVGPGQPDDLRVRPDAGVRRHPGPGLAAQQRAGGDRAGAAGGRDRGPGGVRAGPDGLPGQEDHLRHDRGHAVRAGGHPDHPELHLRRRARLAGQPDRGDRAGGGERVRGVLPAAVLRRAAAGAGGGGVRGRRRTVPHLLVGGPAAVQAGAGHPGHAGVPHQLERLPLAAVRAVQRRPADPAGRAGDAAERQRGAVRPAHGRCHDRGRAGAPALPRGPAVRHPGRVPQRAEGL